MTIKIRTKNPHAVALGKLGGASGTGAAKSRGDADYYRKLAGKRQRVRQLFREQMPKVDKLFGRGK